MEIVDGAGVVVTGGGGGIGRAIARRLAGEGARVVVNDLEPQAGAAGGGEIKGFAAAGDAGTADGVAELIAAARAQLGEIDVYCSNAGTGGGTSAATPDDDVWPRVWEVNTMAHVRAARELLPGWLERGRGTFVITASAAGLLTMLGAAPYSVTKHAAEGYAAGLGGASPHRRLS